MFVILRGMVGWLGGGFDFFISLVDYVEWFCKYLVFVIVVDDDIFFIEIFVELLIIIVIWEGVLI